MHVILLMLAGARAQNAPHTTSTGITCFDCHTFRGATLPHLLRGPCESCHDDARAPAVQTHSAEVVGDPTYGDWAWECWDCHSVHRFPSGDALVEGTIAAAAPGDDTTTLTVEGWTALDPEFAEPATWSAKRGEGRGLLLVTSTSSGTTRTAEVLSADATTVTVDGRYADLAPPVDFELHYGDLVWVDGATLDGPGDFAEDESGTGTDATPDGVCQVCHTQTRYWRADGTGATHHSGEDCVDCHDHDDGFGPSCRNCHGYPPTDASELVSQPSATGSSTAGAHAAHVDDDGFPCTACHAGGMPESPVSGDDTVQIGFDWAGYDGTGTTWDGEPLTAPFAWEGTGGTAVTEGGSLVCTNTYCHSDGKALVYGETTHESTSPAWDAGTVDRNADGDPCDDCHRNPPHLDAHTTHTSRGFTCDLCHYAVTDGTSILDPDRHVDGSYDVDPAPTFTARRTEHALSFTYTWAEGGGTCSDNTCHQYYIYKDPMTWRNRDRDYTVPAVFTATEETTCGIFDVDITAAGCLDCLEPLRCDVDWGDGTAQVDGDCTGLVHDYGPTPDRYTVTWSIVDAAGHTASEPVQEEMLFACQEPNTGPTVDVSFSQTAGIYDLVVTNWSTDPDWNTGGHAGQGWIRIDWGDGTEDTFETWITDPPTGDTFQHVYDRRSYYWVRVGVMDNSGAGWVWYPVQNIRVDK